LISQIFLALENYSYVGVIAGFEMFKIPVLTMMYHIFKASHQMMISYFSRTPVF